MLNGLIVVTTGTPVFVITDGSLVSEIGSWLITGIAFAAVVSVAFVVFVAVAFASATAVSATLVAVSVATLVNGVVLVADVEFATAVTNAVAVAVGSAALAYP